MVLMINIILQRFVLANGKCHLTSQFMTSYGGLQMIDRAEADDVFNLGRQRGVAVFE